MYSDTLKTLDAWSKAAYDNEDLFLDTFSGVNDSWFLTKVSWNDENMHFVYVIKCGQHIADTVKIDKWFEFLKTNEL